MDELGNEEKSPTHRLFTACSSLQSLLNNFVSSHITRTPAWVKTTWLTTWNYTHAPSRTVGWHRWNERLPIKMRSQWWSRGGLHRPKRQQLRSHERISLHARLHVRTWCWFVGGVHESRRHLVGHPSIAGQGNFQATPVFERKRGQFQEKLRRFTYKLLDCMNVWSYLIFKRFFFFS